MPVEVITVLICEICGRRSNRMDSADWVQFEQVDMVLDRTFHKRTICPSCLGDIEKAKSKQFPGGRLR